MVQNNHGMNLVEKRKFITKQVGGNVKVSTCGSVLVIESSRDLSLPAFLVNISLGQFFFFFLLRWLITFSSTKSPLQQRMVLGLPLSKLS